MWGKLPRDATEIPHSVELQPVVLFKHFSIILKKMDHTISTLAPSSVTMLSREAILDITSRYPRLTRAFWWNTLVEEAIGRQWLVSIGQRTALERIAHLFCEIYVRLQVRGPGDTGRL